MKNMAGRISAIRGGYVAKAGRLAVAAVVYTAVACFFFQSSRTDIQRGRWLIGVNWVVGAMGCFLLSRRWIAAFTGSLFAGALYGFSPFALGFAAYHPLAGAPLAMLPWLFCPAAFWRRWTPSVRRRIGRFGAAAVTAILCVLPFGAIAAFFWLCGRPWIGPVFPLPVSLRLQVAGLAGLAAPLAMRPHDFIFSFYHVPIAALAMGLCMYFASGRIAVILIIGGAAVLAFVGPVVQVSPVVWALIPMLFGAIVIGLGMEGLAWAGPGDGRWLLFCAAATGVVTAGCLYLGLTDGILYRRAALLHAGGLLSVGVIYALTRANLRLHLLRWTLLSAAMAVDILTSGRQFTDMVL